MACSCCVVQHTVCFSSPTETADGGESEDEDKYALCRAYSHASTKKKCTTTEMLSHNGAQFSRLLCAVFLNKDMCALLCAQLLVHVDIEPEEPEEPSYGAVCQMTPDEEESKCQQALRIRLLQGGEARVYWDMVSAARRKPQWQRRGVAQFINVTNVNDDFGERRVSSGECLPKGDVQRRRI